MTALRTLSLSAVALFALAMVAPAGSSVTGNGACGPALDIRDPGLRASFVQFDANQSSAAARVCAFYRNADLSR